MEKLKMNDGSKFNDKYQSVLEHVRYEGQLLWQIFGSFLLAHTVFLAFLLHSALGSEQIVGYHPGPFFAALAGLLLCVPWAASYLRSSAYYIFRMAQAKEAEPPNWDIIRRTGEKFAAGKKVTVGRKTYRIGWLARVLRTKRSVPLLIVVFVMIYLTLFILNGPWW